MRLSQGPSAELKATPFCLSQYGTLRHPDAKNLHPGHGDTYVRCSTPATVYKQGGTKCEAGCYE